MTKSDLIKLVEYKYPGLLHADCARAVETIFNSISNTLVQGDRVELRNFGTFAVKKRSARIGRNPRSGASVDVPETSVPYFRTGKSLRDRINAKS
jgi:integration host factor subunit beta